MSVDKSNATPEATAQQAGELAAMRRMLEVSRGTFSLSIAVCNSPALCEYLIQQLQGSFPDIAVVGIADDVSDPYGFVKTQLADRQPAALFVTDLERIIPSQATDQPALHSLNASRELWEQRFPCPVVFWLPEYAATLLSTTARDFWRYRSHRFEFVSEFATAANALADRFSGDLSAASNLSQDEKRFRIAELEQRLADVDVPSEPAMTAHVLQWLNELGFLHFALGDLDNAEERWRVLDELANVCEASSTSAIAHRNLGIVLATRGDLEGAEAMYHRALVIDEKLGLLEGMASDYGNLGNLLQIRGDLEGAEAMYHRALEIDEKLGRLEGIASTYSNLGNVLQIRGDLGGAETMYLRALVIDEKLGWLEGMARHYGNLGLILRTRGDLDEAEAMHRKALEINERLGRIEGMAIQFGNLGVVLKMRGDLDGAEAMYRKALEIDERLGRLEGLAIHYGNLGNVMDKRSDLDEAEAMHRKALGINEKLGRLEGMANQYGNLGLIMKQRGDFGAARKLWTQARDLFEKLGAKHMVEKHQGWIDELPE